VPGAPRPGTRCGAIDGERTLCAAPPKQEAPAPRRPGQAAGGRGVAPSRRGVPPFRLAHPARPRERWHPRPTDRGRCRLPTRRTYNWHRDDHACTGPLARAGDTLWVALLRLVLRGPRGGQDVFTSQRATVGGPNLNGRGPSHVTPRYGNEPTTPGPRFASEGSRSEARQYDGRRPVWASSSSCWASSTDRSGHGATTGESSPWCCWHRVDPQTAVAANRVWRCLRAASHQSARRRREPRTSRQDRAWWVAPGRTRDLRHGPRSCQVAPWIRLAPLEVAGPEPGTVMARSAAIDRQERSPGCGLAGRVRSGRGRRGSWRWLR
jgi:hypothetical protein